MESILRLADYGRSRVLKFVLAPAIVRKIYRQKAGRLLLYFSLVAFAAVLAAILFTPVVILAGPLIYGVPHLWSTFRHVSVAAGIGSRRRLVLWAALACALFSLALFHQKYEAFGIEGLWFFLAFTALLFAAVKRIELSAAVSLTAVAIFLFRFPVETAVFLLFAHNFVAFYYWWKAAGTAEERSTVQLAFTGTVLLCSLILFGSVDAYLHRFGWGFEIPDLLIRQAALPAEWLGEPGYLFALRLITAFAFTQSIHYFVWLVAIPQQNSPYDNPRSVARNARAIVKDIGPVLTIALVLSVAGYWVFSLIGFERAWLLYIVVAASHGYFELAALPFVKGRDELA